jgi:hypothetical protein
MVNKYFKVLTFFYLSLNRAAECLFCLVIKGKTDYVARANKVIAPYQNHTRGCMKRLQETRLTGTVAGAG